MELTTKITKCTHLERIAHIQILVSDSRILCQTKPGLQVATIAWFDRNKVSAFEMLDNNMLDE